MVPATDKDILDYLNKRSRLEQWEAVNNLLDYIASQNYNRPDYVKISAVKRDSGYSTELVLAVTKEGETLPLSRPIRMMDSSRDLLQNINTFLSKIPSFEEEAILDMTNKPEIENPFYVKDNYERGNP